MAIGGIASAAHPLVDLNGRAWPLADAVAYEDGGLEDLLTTDELILGFDPMPVQLSLTVGFFFSKSLLALKERMTVVERFLKACCCAFKD